MRLSNPSLLHETIRLSSLSLLVLLCFSTADAELVNGTTFSGDTVIDTSTNMEWLDFTETRGLSPDAAVAHYSVAGWRWANNDEVTALLDQFFIGKERNVFHFRPKPDPTFRDYSGTCGPKSLYSAFIELFGRTGGRPGTELDRFTAAHYDDQVEDENQEAMFWNGIVSVCGPVRSMVAETDSGLTNPLYGVFLTRELKLDAPVRAEQGLVLLPRAFNWASQRVAALRQEIVPDGVRTSATVAAIDPAAATREIAFSNDVAVLDFHASPDLSSNGHPELVVVSRDPSIVEVRDSRNGAMVNRFKLHPAYDPVASALFESTSGQPSIAVLSRHKTKQTVSVREYDLTTGAILSTVYFNSSFAPTDLVAIPATGDKAPRFGVLAVKDDSGKPSKLEVRDRAGNVDNFFLGKPAAPTHAVLLPGAGYKADVAVVAQDSLMTETVVSFVDTNGDRATTPFGANPNFRPKLLFATDAGNPNGSTQVSILTRNPKEGKDKIETRDASTQALIHNYWVWSTYVADGAVAVGAVPRVAGGDVRAYVVLERHRATDSRQLAVINSMTGDRLLNIPLDD